ERNDGVADEGPLSDDEAGKLCFKRSGQLGDLGCVDARFFGDHDPPWRVTLFRTGRTLLPELREILAHEVAFTAGDEALVGGIERCLLVRLDHLAVGAEGYILAGSERRRIVLRLTRHGLAGHVDPLGALHPRPAAGSRTVPAVASGPAVATAGTGTCAGAGASASAGPCAVAIPVAIAARAGSRTRARRCAGAGVGLRALARRVAIRLRGELLPGRLQPIDR